MTLALLCAGAAIGCGLLAVLFAACKIGGAYDAVKRHTDGIVDADWEPVHPRERGGVLDIWS